MIEQLPLGIAFKEDATFYNYREGKNEALLFFLKETFLTSPDDYLAYIWGGHGSGKTHLLRAMYHLAIERDLKAVYLALHKEHTFDANIFQGLEQTPMVCIDNIHLLAGHHRQEELFFHFFNRHRDNQGHLLVSSDCSPKHLTIALPDLKSRLMWGTCFHLHALTDEQKLAVIQARIQSRGLKLEPQVGRFILSRCARDMAQLLKILDQLDQASLANQRALTIPFVKEVLGL